MVAQVKKNQSKFNVVNKIFKILLKNLKSFNY